MELNCFLFADTPKKIVIPESLAIQLANSSEISAENFFKNIFRRYQRLQRQEERERKLLRKALSSTRLPAPTKTVERSDTSDVNDTLRRNATHSPDVSATIVQAIEQNAYMDDEDMSNDYDESESSGANRLQLNETSSAYIYDDND